MMLLNVLTGDRSQEAVRLIEGGAWFYDEVLEAKRSEWKERLAFIEHACLVHARVPYFAHGK